MIYFSCLQDVESDCAANPASYLMGTMASLPGVKRSGSETDVSPPFITEVNDEWTYNFTSQMHSQYAHRQLHYLSDRTE